MIDRKPLPAISSKKIRIHECKLCEYKGTRKAVRKHIRENHLARGEELSKKVKSKEF